MLLPDSPEEGFCGALCFFLGHCRAGCKFVLVKGLVSHWSRVILRCLRVALEDVKHLLLTTLNNPHLLLRQTHQKLFRMRADVGD
jgi:hypothetical protein